jgi:hypothetical protein
VSLRGKFSSSDKPLSPPIRSVSHIPYTRISSTQKKPPRTVSGSIRSKCWWVVKWQVLLFLYAVWVLTNYWISKIQQKSRNFTSAQQTIFPLKANEYHVQRTRRFRTRVKKSSSDIPALITANETRGSTYFEILLSYSCHR